ncbi:MAG: amidohydrolase family protein [Gemmatimonadota bacterium]|nr:amidohydrolase family protein [Gemmatimonadota bacterium]MDH5758417.1 amidohydrolase family protein [Gemmatimonadota bacterium]
MRARTFAAVAALFLGALAPLAAQTPTLALVGGRVLDGYGGPILENGTVLIAGERIVAVGPSSQVDVPAGVRVVNTQGMTVMPGLCDMHVHLQLLGHGDYQRWDELYGERNEEVMAMAAGQLLQAGVTCARDLGGPLDELVATKRKIAAGEIPGPRLFISGPFLQHAPYEPWQADYRWGVNGAQDAAAKTRRLIEAGVDVIKLIDQDQLTHDEVAAIVATAHAAGRPVVAHAHRMEEIRVGLEHGVDNFEHTGLGTAPGYAPDVLQALRERNTGLWWTPTISPLYVMQYTGEVFPERLDDPSWRAGIPDGIADEIRESLSAIPHLPYYALFPSRIPRLPTKFAQLRETGVRMLIGTDSGIPSMFHIDSTWREMAKWEDLGVPSMEIIQSATLWPARFLRQDAEFGTVEAGKLADIIAVRGDPLTDMGAMRYVELVVKGGEVVREGAR